MNRSFSLGKLILPHPILYAPLAGCSDFPFRKMARKYGNPALLYCEMVKMDPLVRRDSKTYRYLDYEESMRPIGAQLCGSKPQIAGEAAKILEDLGFDVIDLNCGCPVDKVTKDGSGSGMLKTPHLIGEVLSEIVRAVNIPVTVKIRMGWDEEQINAEQIAEIAEQAGACAITVHGRTREQGYKGPARWDPIRGCKERVQKIRVIGNGDVVDAASAQKMFEQTGCDAVLVARGTMGRPWVAQEILAGLKGESMPEKEGHEIKEVLLEHFAAICEYQPERQAVLDMRRVGCWYLKRFPGARSLRKEINQSDSSQRIWQVTQEFAWQDVCLEEEEAHTSG